jgi:hypothetical protein
MAEEIVGPDAQGMYARVRDGVVVETWYGAQGVQGSVAPVSTTTTIDRTGKIVPAGTALPAETLPAPATTTSTPAENRGRSTDWASPRGGSDDPFTGGGGGGYQSRPGSDYGGGFGTGARGYGDGDVGEADPFATLPAYRDGRAHPAAGGQPLVAGGPFAQQDAEGFDDRRQMTSDSGASAGPFGVQSPRSEWNPLQKRAFDESGRAYATRGDNRSPQYDALRAKGDAMAGKVRGMAENIRSGGGGVSSSATTSDPYAQQQRQYARQGRRLDRAYEDYNDELYDPDPMAVKGWSKRQGFKPGTIDAALADPTMLLTSVFPGYESRDSPYSENLEALPMTDLALITAGTGRKRGLTSKTPVVDVPGILRKQGVKPVKPENKRTLDSSKVANKIAQMYKSLGTPGADPAWMDEEQLLGNLATAKKGSILRQNLRTQFDEDPASAMQSVASYVRSAMSAGPDTVVQRALIEDVDRQVTNQGRSILRTKPKRADRIIKPLARSYL